MKINLKRMCICGYTGNEHTVIDLGDYYPDQPIYICPDNQSGLAPDVFLWRWNLIWRTKNKFMEWQSERKEKKILRRINKINDKEIARKELRK